MHRHDTSIPLQSFDELVGEAALAVLQRTRRLHRKDETNADAFKRQLIEPDEDARLGRGARIIEDHEARFHESQVLGVRRLHLEPCLEIGEARAQKLGLEGCHRGWRGVLDAGKGPWT